MAEPDLSRVYDALRKADAAGNTADAKRLADHIRSVRAQSTAPQVQLAPLPEPVSRGRAFSESAVQAVPGAQQVIAGIDALTHSGFGTEGETLGQRYSSARRKQEELASRGAEEQPGASRLGTGAAVVTQLGGPVAVARLAIAAPKMIRALVSRGILSKEALFGALQGAGLSAAYGAALSDADIPLAEGQPGVAGQQALNAATDPATLALGAGLGAAAGAGKARLQRHAAEMSGKAEKLEELHRVQLAEAQYPAAVEAAKARALAESRAPTPENATRWFGLDRLTGRTAGATKARSVRLMNEPVPGVKDGETWMQARARFGDDVPAWQQHVEGVKGQLGDELGDIRAALSSTDDARVSAEKLKESLTAAAGPLPTDKVEAQLSKVMGMVDNAAKDGSVPAAKLRQLIKNLEEGKAWKLRRAAVDAEKRLVAQHLPQENERYRRLLGQWADANELSLGAEAQFRTQNKGSTPIRFDKPVKVDVPEPQFTGGPEKRAEAEALLDEFLTPMQKLERATIRSAGGAIGGALGAASGLPYAGYGGAASGYQGAQALSEKWVKATRPTIGGVINDTVAARSAFARWGPQMDAALRSGPRAVRSLHRALSQSDPEYAEMMENTGRAAPEPLSFGEFSSGWRKGQ